METNTAGTDPAKVRVPAKNVVAMAGWARFLVPSVCDLWFVLLVLALTWGPLAKGLLGDGGIGWHIRTGQLIVSGHTIPRVDPFSSTMHGQAWFAWEWLYDAAISAIHHWTGLNGVAFSSALVIALTFTIVFRMMLARHANLVPAAGMLLLTVAASTIHVFARPHVLSWLLTVIWFGILDRFEANGETRQLLWLPVLTLLWVNVHGGFVVGFILLIIFFAGALVNWLGARNQQDRGAALLRIEGL